jgi:hypothetical protein
MNKQDDVDGLSSLERGLSKIKISLNKVKSKLVYKKELRDSVRTLSKKWFEEVEPAIQRYAVSEEAKTKYHQLFTRLLDLSIRTSRKNTYLKTIIEILADFKTDLMIPVLKSAGKIVIITHLTKVLENITEEEKEYLSEALGCAANGFFRASIVLAWSAAAHRMHKMVERLGFDEFNKKSEEMRNINEGRFRRFKKSFNVHSLSEFRATVFDNDLLWVLEYWGLIDSNQHDRLSSCLTMRNNSAHPGEAPVTEENLTSFYSDLKNIVFDNPKFKLE